ncbi:MAG TPA: ribose-5-phosphate isomerase RpiA [Flavisolibacter sp.]|nr:ribose-5-phosphate isomerase RpiA [Flavisolibacter sp.]
MNAKEAAAHQAVTYVEDGMVVGLGTGSTALYAIQKLGNLYRQGMKLTLTASSVQSEKIAVENGLILTPPDTLSQIDLYIDGADEIDASYNLIKGGGGALVREKILAASAQQFIVIADSSKCAPHLGSFPLAVEIVPFGHTLTLRHLEDMQGKPLLRMQDGQPFRSDNGNFIADCHFGLLDRPEEFDLLLNSIPGVVENGLFPSALVSLVIIGNPDGSTKEYSV